jgi:WD40 repeat protein
VARTLRCDLEQIHDLAFDPAGVRLAVAGGAPGAEGHVLLFTWPQLVPAGRVVGHRDVITSVAFSPSGVELATGGFDRVTRVTPVGPGAVPAAARVTLSGHAGPVLAAGWTPGAQTLVTAGGDRSLKVWSAEDGGLVRSLNNHTDAVNCLAFRPARGAGARSPYCATGSDDRTARVWQPELGRMVRIIRGAPAPVLAVAYSRDGSTLFTAGAEGVVRAVDGESDEIKHAWPAVDGWIYSLAVRPDGRELAAAGSMGKVFRLAVDPA